MRQTAVAVAVVLLLAGAAVGCSDSGGDEPASKPSTATSSPVEKPAVSKEEAAQACTDAVAKLEPDEDGGVPFEPVPADCAALSDSEYLDAYTAGINQSNQEGIEDLERLLEEAEASAAAEQ